MTARLRAWRDKLGAVLTNRVVLLESAPSNNRVQGRGLSGELTAEVISSAADYADLRERCDAPLNLFATRRFEAQCTLLAVRREAHLVTSGWSSTGGGGRHWCLETSRSLRSKSGERILFDLATPEAYRGRGYAEQVIRLAQLVFVDDHLIVYVLDSNASSLRVFEKCGFREAGTFRWCTPNALGVGRRTRHA